MASNLSLTLNEVSYHCFWTRNQDIESDDTELKIRERTVQLLKLLNILVKFFRTFQSQ